MLDTTIARRTTLTLLAAFALLTVLPLTGLAPVPDAVPRRWELRLTPGPLRVATVELEDGPRWFYYFTYRVENHSGEDRFFAPKFELMTSEGELIRSLDNVPREASEDLRKRLKSELVQDELRIQGMLLQGKENARDGIVVWALDELDVDEVVVFASGFSGETKTVIRPDDGKRAILRKTRMLRHVVPGRLDPTSSDPLERTVDLWIMR